MKEYLLAVEYPSFLKDKMTITRISFKVRFTTNYERISIIIKGQKPRKGVQWGKSHKNMICVDPSVMYHEFKAKVIEYISKTMKADYDKINLKWLKRPPMIEDVVNFEWNVKKRNATPI